MSGDRADTWNARQFGWQRALMGARLTSATTVVGLALAGFANGQSGECWPSAPEIAEAAGVSVRTVLRALPMLEDAGLVEVLRGCGRGRRSVYRMVMPAGAARNVVSLRAVSRPVSGRSRPVDNPVKGCHPVTVSQTERVTNCPVKGDKLSAPYEEELTERTYRGAGEDACTVSRRWSAWNGGVWLRQDGTEVARWQAWLAGMGMGDPVALCPRRGEGAEVEIRLPTHWLPDPGSIPEMLVMALFRDLAAEAAETAQSESRRQA
jgi:DNA-binding transcriptional ArsR family regulator